MQIFAWFIDGSRIRYMDYQEKLEISYYKEIAALNKEYGVFLVQHNGTGRICVKKILKTYNLDVYHRIRSAGVPGLPRIFHMDEEGGTLTLIEEYISGDTLRDIIKRNGAFSDRQIFSIMLRLCSILEAIHGIEPPVIHRDIKPSNIILTQSGEVYLLDLNAAKLEDAKKQEDTVLLGTYGYAAPEQYGFGSSTIQTDIFAVGMVMNTMARGSYSREIASGSVFSEIIKKCVMLNPDERYVSATELKAAILSPQKHAEHHLRIPGFRTGNPMHIFTAIVGYIAIFSLALTLETNNQRFPLVTWYERIFNLNYSRGLKI